MKKYLRFFILLLGISTNLFAETWTSPQGQVFTFTNNTSISLKKGDLESIAKHFYKWKSATIVLSFNKSGIPLCTVEISSENYDAYSSDKYVPYLRSWIAGKIDNKNQQGNFLASGFLISSIHKLPNGSITQYGALRNSGYVKFDDTMTLKAGPYSKNFDASNGFPEATEKDCNDAYLWYYINENYAKIATLPVPVGLNSTFKKDLENLYSNITKHNWGEVSRVIKKYDLHNDFGLWSSPNGLIWKKDKLTLFTRLFLDNAPIDVWECFISFQTDDIFKNLIIDDLQLGNFNNETLKYLCEKMNTSEIGYIISKFRKFPDKIETIVSVLESKDNAESQELANKFRNYTNLEELEEQRIISRKSIEEFYLERRRIGNYDFCLLENLCLSNQTEILDKLFKTKIKYSLIVIAGKNGSPTEELLYFFTDNPDWKKESYCYSTKDNAFVYNFDYWSYSHSRTIGEQLQEDNYFAKLYKDLIFKANYYFSKGFPFYNFLIDGAYDRYTKIEDNFYTIFKGYYYHSTSSANYFDKYATYPEWVNKSEDDDYICNLELKNSNNDTILIFAIQQGNSKFANKLIKQGIDIKAINNDGKTALDIAIEVGDKKTEKELRKLLGK